MITIRIQCGFHWIKDSPQCQCILVIVHREGCQMLEHTHFYRGQLVQKQKLLLSLSSLSLQYAGGENWRGQGRLRERGGDEEMDQTCSEALDLRRCGPPVDRSWPERGRPGVLGGVQERHIWIHPWYGWCQLCYTHSFSNVVHTF